MDNKKDILIDFLIPIAGEGGAERVMNVVLEYLNNNGFHARVVQLISDGSRHFNSDIDVYPILINQRVNDLSELSGLYTAFLSQYGVPDIVVATSWPYLILTARKALEPFNTPCKVYSWLHNALSEYSRYGAGGIECMRLADHHLCISRHAADILIKDNPNVSTSLTYNPVDMSQYIPQTQYHSDSRTLLYVGRLSPEKRVDIILKGLDSVNMRQPGLPWKLRIVGDGDERRSIIDLIDELRLGDYVTLTGWQSNPWQYCDDITALVVASECEGGPLVAVEALANGIPVISTPVDGVIKLITPGINGWLFPHNDHEALADILCAISDGTLPAIKPRACTESVSCYERGTALANFKRAIYDGLDKISIIVYCFNAEEQLRKCLDSLLSQTLTRAAMEIICVDNHSTDNSLDILSEYEQKYSDIFMLIPLSESIQPEYAKDIALDYSTGDYITYMDTGACIPPTLLEELYTRIKIYGGDIEGRIYKKSTLLNRADCTAE